MKDSIAIKARLCCVQEFTQSRIVAESGSEIGPYYSKLSFDVKYLFSQS
jgi:hypothetical protein